MLTRLLHLKRKEKTCEQTNKNCLGRQQKPQSTHWSVQGTQCVFRSVHEFVCLLEWFLFIAPLLYNASKHVLYLHRRWMLVVFKHVIRGYEKRTLKNFTKFMSGAHSSFSLGIVLEVMASSFTIHLTSKMVGKVKRGTPDSNINCSLVLGCDVNRVGEMEGEVLTRKTDGFRQKRVRRLLTHSSPRSTCNFLTGRYILTS